MSRGFLCLLTALLSLAVLASVQGQDNSASQNLSVWIEALGGPRWEDRERATEQLLEAGAPAIPALRAARESADPEVRQRVEWILSVLDPPRYQVEILRLGNGEGEPRALRERLLLDLTGRHPAGGVTTDLDGEGTRFSVRLEGTASEPTVVVERPERGAAAGMRVAVKPGNLSPFIREDVVEEERVAGRVIRSLRRSLWILRLAQGADAGAPTPLSPAPVDMTALGAALLDQQGDGDEEACRKAFTVAAFARRPDWIVAREPSPEGLRVPWLTARLAAGDDDARGPLETEWTTGEDEDTRVPALLALTRAGSRVGLEGLLDRLSELSLWNKYLAVAELSERLADPTLPTDQTLSILDVVCAPSTFTYLPWSGSIETELLLQRLQDRAPVKDFARYLRPLLEENLGSRDQSVFLREQALLRSLVRAVWAGALPVDEWFEFARTTLSGRHFDTGFGLVRDARLAGNLDDERWDLVLTAVAETLRDGEPGNARRADDTVRTFLSTPALPLADVRRLHAARLECFTQKGSFNRQSLDRELDTLLGPLEDRAPGRSDEKAWKKRLGLRMTQLETAAPEALRPTADPPKKVLLTEVDFRIDHDRRSVRQLSFRRRELGVGETIPELGLDGEDRSVLVDSFGVNRGDASYRLGLRGRPLVPGKPELRGYHRSRNRFNSYRMSDRAYGRQSVDNRRSVAFQTLLLLEDPAEAEDFESWKELQALIVTRATSEESSERQGWLALVQDLRIEAALPALRRLFESAPDTQIALALLGLDDASGVELLRSGINVARANQGLPTLQKLIEFGDAASVEMGLQWLEVPPQSLRNRSYLLVDALLRAIWGPQPTVRVGEERALGAMVAALKERSNWHRVIPLLRRRSGEDFGFYDAMQQSTPAARQQAQQASIERWQEWWADRSSQQK